MRVHPGLSLEAEWRALGLRPGRPASPSVTVALTPQTESQRPLQVTRDLASFWRNAYIEVRKDMRGRYPRHYWPENPLEAEPTRGIKKRR